MESDRNKTITRRELMTMLGAVGFTGAVAWKGAKAISTTTDNSDAQPSGTCVLTPALTMGPFFVDEKLKRSDLTLDTGTGKTSLGVPLTLNLAIASYSPDACTPLANAQVDVWHCDASGAYSDERREGSSGKTFLRGYQISDSSGRVVFKTIYPGWYRGRTPHIHIMVRPLSSFGEPLSEFTTQMFFDEAVTDAVYAVAPYRRHGMPDTTNSSDGIFHSAMKVTPSGTVQAGYNCALTIGVRG